MKNFLINSEFFYSPNMAFNVKYINTIDIVLHNDANGDVIVDTDELNIVNKLTTEASATGIFAVVTAAIIVVNDFLLFLFIIRTITDITKTLITGAIVALIIDIKLVPKPDHLHIDPTAKHLAINSAATHITKIIIAYFRY